MILNILMLARLVYLHVCGYYIAVCISPFSLVLLTETSSFLCLFNHVSSIDVSSMEPIRFLQYLSISLCISYHLLFLPYNKQGRGHGFLVRIPHDHKLCQNSVCQILYHYGYLPSKFFFVCLFPSLQYFKPNLFKMALRSLCCTSPNHLN